ncbi:MAG: Sec-independent protein translocase subunit TatA/TatB [Vulcanimicrobiaceae bacterium]
MLVHPMLAFLDTPIVIGLIALAALLFGADKLPKLARSAGEAKREFLKGQLEADEAANQAREDARRRSATESADPMDNVQAGSMAGSAVPSPDPGKGTPSS